jgi:hypothetical protein
MLMPAQSLGIDFARHVVAVVNVTYALPCNSRREHRNQIHSKKRYAGYRATEELGSNQLVYRLPKSQRSLQERYNILTWNDAHLDTHRYYLHKLRLVSIKGRRQVQSNMVAGEAGEAYTHVRSS